MRTIRLLAIAVSLLTACVVGGDSTDGSSSDSTGKGDNPAGEPVDCAVTPADPQCQPQTPEQPQNPGTPETPEPPEGPDPCATDPDSDECYCAEVPEDPFCNQACQTNPTDPQCQDPCQANPTDPQCQDPCQANPADPQCANPCEQDPYSDACYCSEVPEDPYCQGT